MPSFPSKMKIFSILENNCRFLPVMDYFTWKLEFVWNILSMIIIKYSEKFCLAPRWKINWPRWVQFFYISLLNSLNLVLIRGAKLDGLRGTWWRCLLKRNNFIRSNAAISFIYSLKDVSLTYQLTFVPKMVGEFLHEVNYIKNFNKKKLNSLK